jgi:hypothetical protein
VFRANLLPHETRLHFPEIALLAAVFEDALRCAQRSSRGVTHRQSAEAFEWIASEQRNWPFAFLNVCELLGVNAAAVRDKLRIGDDASVAAFSRSSDREPWRGRSRQVPSRGDGPAIPR